MERRAFLKALVGMGGAAVASPLLETLAQTAHVHSRAFSDQPAARVAFVKTRDRAAGVQKAIDLLDSDSMKGKALFVKPNFNSADPTPGSTHPDVLSALAKKLQALGVDQITVGDRSGMGDTREVMQQLDLFRMADELNFKAVVLDELRDSDYELLKPQGSHWKRGFAMPRLVLKADGVVQTCCLKTHRYGGHFTLSLKNSVGLAAKTVPGESYNYMTELHSSPDQRRMIAELNTAYQPDLIVMDGVQAFVDGGPDQGKRVDSEVILASSDRIAIDAVGVAILRYFGTNATVSRGTIFQQDQIARAVALGLGVTGPDQIELVTDDSDSAAYADKIRAVLRQ
jgi:uncharacterized protein (DUF362 family)